MTDGEWVATITVSQGRPGPVTTTQRFRYPHHAFAWLVDCLNETTDGREYRGDWTGLEVSTSIRFDTSRD